MKCRGHRFIDEDDAYDFFRQRDVDDQAEDKQEEIGKDGKKQGFSFQSEQKQSDK